MATALPESLRSKVVANLDNPQAGNADLLYKENPLLDGFVNNPVLKRKLLAD